MPTISQLTTFILGSLKDEEGGRVALYHFLKNFFEGSEIVTPELINDFFAECLQLPHWQENRMELHRDICELLQRFFSQQNAPFSMDKLWDLSRLQMILLNQCENLYMTVKQYEQSSLKEGENLRLIADGNSRIVVIRRGFQGQVTVRTYNNLVRIEGAQLIPLGHDQELHYNQGLELQPLAVQKLRPAPHSQVRFRIAGDGVHAQFSSGFAFRQTQTLKLTALSQESRIFYPLKRLERFYVYRPSDPYYAELISTLDKALQMVRNGDADAKALARKSFEGGQIAFDQIFPDDKVLYSKLKELARDL